MIGKIILDSYQIIDVIGKGGMSCVYLAENIRLHNRWAIKAVRKEGRKKVALLAEPNILKNLSHFALPRIVDICEDEENLYIIMDYVEGIGLDKLLSAKGQFDEDQVVSWAKELCDVFDYLHHQSPPIIYRDLKPGNLIVDKNNHLRMIDFGIAAEYKGVVREEEIYVTRGYAAPEQYEYEADKDGRMDIYALGATMYVLCTGKNPGTLSSPLPPIYQWNRNLSDGLDTIIRICMETNPADRFQTAEQLLYALNHIHRYNTDYRKKRRKYQIGIAASLMGICFSAVLIFAGITVNGREKNEKYNDLISEGVELAMEGEYSDAREYFEEAIEQQPETIDAYLGIANTMISQYQYEECMEYISDTVLDMVPDAASNGKLNYLLGSLYDKMDNSKDALYFYQKAVELEPDEQSYRQDYVYALIQSGELEDAEDELDELDGSDGIYSYLKARLAGTAGDLEVAEQEGLRCIEENSDEALRKNTILYLAELYESEARNTGDSAWYEKEISLLDRSDMWLKNGPYVEILEKKGETWYRKAAVSHSEDDYLKAAECFGKLIEMGYHRPYIYRNIAIIYQTQGMWEDAESILLKLLERDPDQYVGWYQLALLYMEIEAGKTESERDYTKMLEAYEHAVQLTRGTAYEQELEPLTLSVKELAEKGWIQWEQ